MKTEIYALAALAPMMIGPLPASADTITAQLCNGGSLVIPIKRYGDEEPGRDCRFQACHAGTYRKRALLTQPN